MVLVVLIHVEEILFSYTSETTGKKYTELISWRIAEKHSSKQKVLEVKKTWRLISLQPYIYLYYAQT